MRIAVIGAGVVGLASAWYLTRLGHAVTVVEQHADVALETSFGNAGGLCPGFSGPWARPGMPFKVIKWLWAKNAPLKWHPRMQWQQWQWLGQFAANCRESRYLVNKSIMQRMAHYSKRCLDDLCAELDLAFDHANHGVLQLFRDAHDLHQAQQAAQVLDEYAIQYRFVDAAEVRAIEPALALTDAAIAGGLYLPDDATGDSRLFCEQLKLRLQDEGCRFLFDSKVSAVRIASNRVVALRINARRMLDDFDTCVVAAGAFARDTLRLFGVRVPIYPVKGYSLTWPIADDTASPRSSVMDESSKTMINRLGNRVRIAGMAELTGFDRRLPENTLRQLRATLKQLFPHAVEWGAGTPWCGFRPMTPAGPAIIEKTHLHNLFINVGHGSNGWTQACGAGAYLSQLVQGGATDIAYPAQLTSGSRIRLP